MIKFNNIKPLASLCSIVVQKMTGSIHVNTEPGAKTVFDTIRISIEMFEEKGLKQKNKTFNFSILGFSDYSMGEE